jgi:hypothetical protein
MLRQLLRLMRTLIPTQMLRPALRSMSRMMPTLLRILLRTLLPSLVPRHSRVCRQLISGDHPPEYPQSVRGRVWSCGESEVNWMSPARPGQVQVGLAPLFESRF